MLNINYLTWLRFLQIALAIISALAIYLCFQISYGYWIALSVIVIYGPFNETAVAFKIKQRIWGTLLGLLYGFLLIKIIYIQGYIVYLSPLLVFFVMIYMNKNYPLACALITIIILILSVATIPSNISPESFIIDRFIDTLIAALICYFFELIFSPFALTKKMTIDVIVNLAKLYEKHCKRLKEKNSLDKLNASIDRFTTQENILQKQLLELQQSKKYSNYDKNILEILIDKIYSIKLELNSQHYLMLKYYYNDKTLMAASNHFINTEKIALKIDIIDKRICCNLKVIYDICEKYSISSSSDTNTPFSKQIINTTKKSLNLSPDIFKNNIS